MMRELAGVKLVVLINLRAILSDEEMRQFVHNISSRHLDILLLECISREPLEDVKDLYEI